MKKKDCLNQILHGDCLEIMKGIPNGKIDMILCDLPYGTTRNKWDSVIDLDLLWIQYKRIIKENGAIVLNAQTPFDKVLGTSNLEMLRYEWIWEKEAGTGFLNAKKMPLKNHENILVFYKKLPMYNPQMRNGEPYIAKKSHHGTNYGKDVIDEVITTNDGNRYPLTILPFKRDKNKLHSTQKPVALYEYLIKTYTKENDIVLDNCIGSGTTAIACINTNRNFIGIEKEEKYVKIARERISQALGA